MADLPRGEDVLEDDEYVVTRESIGSGDLVVTNERVFVVAPGSTSTSRQIPRHRIESLALTTHLRQSAKHWSGVAGVLGLAARVGAFLRWGLALKVPNDAETADRVGTGGVISAFQSVLDLVSLVDEALAVAAPLLFVGAVVIAVRGRSRVLSFTLDDGEVVRFRAPRADERTTGRLRDALSL